MPTSNYYTNDESSDMDVSSGEEVTLMESDNLPHEELVQNLRKQIQNQEARVHSAASNAQAFTSSPSTPSVSRSSFAIAVMTDDNDADGYESDGSYRTAPSSPTELMDVDENYPPSNGRSGSNSEYESLNKQYLALQAQRSEIQREREILQHELNFKKEQDEDIKLKLLELNVRLSIKKNQKKSSASKPTSPQLVSPRPTSSQLVSPRPISAQLVSPKPAVLQHVSPKPAVLQHVSSQIVPPQNVSSQSVSSQNVLPQNVSSQNVSPIPVSGSNQPLRVPPYTNQNHVISNRLRANASPTSPEPISVKEEFGVDGFQIKNEPSSVTEPYYESGNPAIPFSYKPRGIVGHKKVVRKSHVEGHVSLSQMQHQLINLYQHAKGRLNTYQKANLGQLLKRVTENWGRPGDFIPTRPDNIISKQRRKVFSSPFLLLSHEFYGDHQFLNYQTEVDENLLLSAIAYYLKSETYSSKIPEALQDFAEHSSGKNKNVGQTEPLQAPQPPAQQQSIPVAGPSSQRSSNAKTNTLQNNSYKQSIGKQEKAKRFEPYVVPGRKAVDTDLDVGQHKANTAFTPYKSAFSSLGLNASSSQPAPKQKFNQLCMAESNGGICNDTSCNFMHFEDYMQQG